MKKFTEAEICQLIDWFYADNEPLKARLYQHSCQVRDKALALLRTPAGAAWGLDLPVVTAGALLHDIGIVKCHAPGILCYGQEPYIAHGILGAAMLREYGRQIGWDLEIYARICERHTGAGIAKEEIIAQKLPLPLQDYLPETPLEKLLCFADKFFSKSGDRQEKTMTQARASLAKFGPDSLARFDQMRQMFGGK